MRKLIIILLLLIIILLLLLPIGAYAACEEYTAGNWYPGSYASQSLTSSDVQSCYDDVNFTSGDTIHLKAGSASWAGGVNFGSAKNVIIQGAGIGNTVITLTSGFAFEINESSRLTGVEIKSSTNLSYVIIINSGSGGFRIDHNKFDCSAASGTCVIYTQGTGDGFNGLIDSNIIIDTQIVIYGTYGTVNNTLDEDLGGNTAVFIENNNIDATLYGNTLDSNSGGRVVWRFNSLVGHSNVFIPVEAHSVQGDYTIATQTFEYYNNSITGQWASFLQFGPRGGTGLIYNNVATGTGSCTIGFDNVRSYAWRGSTFGICNGSSIVDGNQAVTNGTGTHTGSSSATLMDSTKSWTVNDFRITECSGSQTCSGTHTSAVESSTTLTDTEATFRTIAGDDLQGYWIQNTTDGSGCVIGDVTSSTAIPCATTLSGGSDNKWQQGDEYVITLGGTITNAASGATGQIRANTSNTVTATLIGGTRQTWENGDEYIISIGYPCRGQIGWGKDSGAWSGPPYPTQRIMPVYGWGNTCNGSTTTMGIRDGGLSAKHIVSGRDFYQASSLSDAKSKSPVGLSSAYQAYTCPHPLATELSGKTCNYTVAGVDGYGVSAIPPTISSGISISGGSVQ